MARPHCIQFPPGRITQTSDPGVRYWFSLVGKPLLVDLAIDYAHRIHGPDLDGLDLLRAIRDDVNAIVLQRRQEGIKDRIPAVNAWEKMLLRKLAETIRHGERTELIRSALRRFRGIEADAEGKAITKGKKP